MRKSHLSIRAFVAAISVASIGFAHVDLAAPVGGEVLAAGSNFTVKWTADDHDCVYNLYFSPDSGKTWVNIVQNLPKATRQHIWTMPAPSTTKGMVRVFQDNATGSDMEGKSKVFTIQGNTGIKGAESVAGNITLRSQSGNLDLGFELVRPAKVTFAAYNAQGKLMVLLTEGRREAGPHRLSIFSNRLPSAGPLVLKLKIDNQVHVFNTTGNY